MQNLLDQQQRLALQDKQLLEEYKAEIKDLKALTMAPHDDGEKEVSFTTNAIHLSNQAIAALNTGDIEGIYARNGAIMVVDKVKRKGTNL